MKQRIGDIKYLRDVDYEICGNCSHCGTNTCNAKWRKVLDPSDACCAHFEHYRREKPT